MNSVKLAVNGTLMRGFEFNQNLIDAGARFLREATTEPCYRLWSIDDVHPAMQKDAARGTSVRVEVWEVPYEGLVSLLEREPPGLCIGRVRLADGEEVLGILGEAHLCEGQREITEYGGWRQYVERKRRDT